MAGNVLAVLLMQVLLAVTGPRVVHFEKGQAVVEQRHGYEHVVVKDRSGRTQSESDCDSVSGTYNRIVRFAREVKSAARRGDHEALAGLMAYPLRVNTAPGIGFVIASRKALLAQFGKVFTADEIRRMSRIEPHDVFCRNGMSMLGDGLLWAKADAAGVLRAVVVNVEAGKRGNG